MDSEYKNWSTLKDVKVIKRTENTLEREAEILRGPMGSARNLQTLAVDPVEKQTTLNMTRGPILGTRNILLKGLGADKTKIEINWELDEGRPWICSGIC